MTTRLGRKQSSLQSNWLTTLDTIEQQVSVEQLSVLVEQTVAAIRARTAGKRVAFAWSGGKDSIVLEGICTQAGIAEGMMGLCDLEYPAFLQWVTDHMPPGLELVHTGQDLAWLAEHPTMLFPQNTRIASTWFHQVQHAAQTHYFRAQQLDMLLLGRRRMDGNYTGPAGADVYTNAQGVTRYSPLRDWTHEDILAYLHYYQCPLPPIYTWPRGYQVGTGPWPARQWTHSTEHGWSEVYSIDPQIVQEAATVLPSAQAFLERRG